ncbi:hypothetical protein O4H66_17155 [Comamonadaceae bacterium G21597-S1]|nr:hypothetical protein [Comamonadaceae bacterium G21597-S1]
MNAPINHNALATVSDSSNAVMGFGNANSFELMQRAAKLLANSTLVPAQYRQFNEKKRGSEIDLIENPSAIANCVVALNMAQRMKADPLMVMQNLYVVEGRPSWSSQWIIAAINGCGRFSPLRFELTDLGAKEVEYTVVEWVDRQRVNKKLKTTIRNWQCVAWAIELATGDRVDSPKVSMEMAVKEGWYGKNGSKWQTMEEVMLRYRTASFFGKLYAPELLMGMQSVEEVQDILTMQPDGSVYVPGKPEVSMPQAKPATGHDSVTTVDQSTGEIHNTEPEAKPAQAIDPADNPEAGADASNAEDKTDIAPAKAKRAASEPGAMATEGERKFIINRVRSAGKDLAELITAAGLEGLKVDLSDLTKDGFIALKDQLPKSA